MCYYLIPTHILLRNRVAKNFKKKIYDISKYIENNEKNINFQHQLLKAQSSINSYYGIFKIANAHKLCVNSYVNSSSILKKYLLLNIDNQNIKVMQRY